MKIPFFKAGSSAAKPDDKTDDRKDSEEVQNKNIERVLKTLKTMGYTPFPDFRHDKEFTSATIYAVGPDKRTYEVSIGTKGAYTIKGA